MSAHSIEIKICGLTSPEAAAACAAAGANAIGMVFHPPSPRNLLPAQARAIAAALPAGVARVGVFVDQPPEEILRIAREVGLDTVQLHTAPAAGTLAFLARHGVYAVQVLRSSGETLLSEARALPPRIGVLVECGSGPLPGGNGATWLWEQAAPLRPFRAFAVAGGLTPDNASEALLRSGASAVDVSSGVESAPGCKDLQKVAALVAAVRAADAGGRGPVFRPPHPRPGPAP
jgi:phosphoribosylanthranilate isomerase